MKQDAFFTTVESMKQVSENYFYTEQGYVNDWKSYIESQHMTEEEALEFIRATNSQQDRAAHIVDLDDLSARSTYVSEKEGEWVHCYEDFQSVNTNFGNMMLEKMQRMYDNATDEVLVLGKYRVGETQQTVVSVGARVNLRQEDGTDKGYLLLRTIPVDYLQKSWVFPTEFPTAQIGLITKGGDYVVQSSAMRSTNFLEFIRAYNFEDDYNKMYELENYLLSTESGSLLYKDSKGQDCYFYFSRFGDDSDIDILGYIPIADTETDYTDWTIVVLICGTLALLAVIDGLYALSINRELKRTAEMAERASQAKTQFLSSMSHDIRTPMNAVIGMTEIAKHHVDDPKYVKHCLDKVSLAGNHLLTLINDILDISKVESGKMTLNNAPFSLRESLDEMTAIIRQNAEEKHIDFKMEMQNVTQDIVVADPLRLRQVLINLLTNAIKYTEEGGHVNFIVSEQPIPGRSDRVGLRFIVADDGMGMSEEFQKTMYASFSRATDSRINKIQGSGLGLAIASQMTELMGGTISCDSKPNVGTTFVVALELPTADKLPHKPATRAECEENDPGEFADLYILAAEDNDLNWEIIHTMLEEYGIRSDRAENGEQCIAMLHDASLPRYDVVLMDVQMPVMDGREATRRIRSDPSERLRNMPVVAMTADAFAEDVSACLEAGMDAHIAKPVDMKQVLRILRKVKEGTLHVNA
ncbi:hybrid sensor histidine kinase/response regulator [Gemmiger sp.]